MKTSKATLLIVGLGLCNLFFAGCAFSDGSSATDMKTRKMEGTMATEGSMKPSGNTGMEKPMAADMAQPMKEGMEKPMAADMAEPMKTGMEKPMAADMAEPMKTGTEKPMQGDTKKMQ